MIALNRLNRILAIDPDARIAVVEPGVINLDVTPPPRPTACLRARSLQPVHLHDRRQRRLQLRRRALPEIRDDREPRPRPEGRARRRRSGRARRRRPERRPGLDRPLLRQRRPLRHRARGDAAAVPVPEAFHTALAVFARWSRPGDAVSAIIGAGLCRARWRSWTRSRSRRRRPPCMPGYPPARRCSSSSWRARARSSRATRARSKPCSATPAAASADPADPGSGRRSGRGARAPSAPWAGSRRTSSCRMASCRGAASARRCAIDRDGARARHPRRERLPRRRRQPAPAHPLRWPRARRG